MKELIEKDKNRLREAENLVEIVFDHVQNEKRRQFKEGSLGGYAEWKQIENMLSVVLDYLETIRGVDKE